MCMATVKGNFIDASIRLSKPSEAPSVFGLRINEGDTMLAPPIDKFMIL